MNLERVKKIADAVLYEGYMLYPYRASSVKNRQRFNWGALVPQSYSEAQKSTEIFSMQTECLAQTSDEDATINIKVRFLHLTMREIGKLENPLDELPENFVDYTLVQLLKTNGKIYQTWQEAVEREVDFPAFKLNADETKEIEFSFPANREIEPLRDANEKIVGVIVRKQEEVKGKIEVRSSKSEIQSADSVYKISVRIFNTTEFENAESKSREEALLHSTVSTHTILTIDGGEFVSLLEYQEEFKDAVAELKNIKTYPVLAGAEGERDCLFSSPIILYDYPQIAEASLGDLFDGGEIDEILTLRIMTLTDEEKREMRSVDDRVRQMLERTESISDEELLKMHGMVKKVNGQT